MSMIKKLGELLLPAELVWQDRHAWSPVVQESVRTINGQSIRFIAALSGGRPITLEALENLTWFDAQQVSALALLAAQAGAVYPLLWGEESYQVVFRHQDYPALDLRALIPDHPAGLHIGMIKLETI
ncbi:MAG: hypothetical protein HQM04_06545 [Magnetococcales bacterium]|nr:hypothetical protein [Magnetococcales bacterium]MBF0114686.1 hypothetical protein [Magnetococcales bacterium]